MAHTPKTFEVELKVKDRLSIMYDAQVDLQLKMKPVGRDPQDLTGADRTQFITVMVYALEDELHELTDEVGWKPWATSNHVNEAAAQSELVDVWHFFMNLMRVLHMTPEMLFEMYAAKRLKNIKRQEEGYDGVSTKCKGCHRALDDEEVHCFYNPEDKIGYCVMKEEVIK